MYHTQCPFSSCLKRRVSLILVVFPQNRDNNKLVVAEGFDMMAVAKTATSLNFTIKDKPLQEVK